MHVLFCKLERLSGDQRVYRDRDYERLKRPISVTSYANGRLHLGSLEKKLQMFTKGFIIHVACFPYLMLILPYFARLDLIFTHYPIACHGAQDNSLI